MNQTKQLEGKPRKLVINKESIRAIASDTIKRNDITVGLFSPCIRCTTTI